MKLIHKLFSRIGVSWGGSKACLKYGCKEYCGFNMSESFNFTMTELYEKDYLKLKEDMGECG